MFFIRAHMKNKYGGVKDYGNLHQYDWNIVSLMNVRYGFFIESLLIGIMFASLLVV